MRRYDGVDVPEYRVAIVVDEFARLAPTNRTGRSWPLLRVIVCSLLCWLVFSKPGA
jgi:hypothetical protein